MVPFPSLQSMEAGVPGHCGTSVLSPVEEGYRNVAGSATAPHPSLEARTVSGMQRKSRSATSRTVQLVSHAAQDDSTLGSSGFFVVVSLKSMVSIWVGRWFGFEWSCVFGPYCPSGIST